MTDDALKRGPYRLLHKLGEGGMGTVWLARHDSSRDLVALKTLSTPDARLLHRFRREIRLLRHLDHPGVVDLLDEGIERDGTPWYVMRLLKGSPLLTHMRRIAAAVSGVAPPPMGFNPPSKPTTRVVTDHWTSKLGEIDTLAQLPPAIEEQAHDPTPRLGHRPSSLGFASTLLLDAARAAEQDQPFEPADEPIKPDDRFGWDPDLAREPLGWMRQLCETLAYVHGEGIVHCDLKPENIVVTEDGRAILVDFGIAERFGARVSHEVLEAAGVQAGTPHYISPEQIRGEPVDARTDLYALGCIFFEILTGAPPFDGGSATNILMHHLTSPAPRPSTRVSALPEGFDALCDRLLAKAPSERIGHARVVAGALESLGVAATSWPGAPTPRPYLYKPGLAGREALTRHLHEIVLSVKAGAPHALAISGESGAGKSRVAAELIARARSQQMLAMSSQCQLMDAGTDESLVGDPLHAFAPMLRGVADACLQEGPQWTARLLGSRARLLLPYAPFLRELPTIDRSAPPPARDPEAARRRLFFALAQTLEQATMRRPALFLFDDLHFADELSLEAIEHLIDFAQDEELPWLITIMHRSEDIPERLEPLLSDARWERCPLERLGDEALGELTAQMLGLKETPPPLLALIIQRTGGNPFYVAEYLRLALEEGLLQQDRQGAWQLAKDASAHDAIDALPVPTSIQELVSGRLARLPEAHLTLVHAVSVLGRASGSKQLAALLDRSRGEVREQLAMLARREILIQERDAISFVHEQLRETAYREIEAPARRELHHRAARLLESSKENVSSIQLGHHWELAGELGRAHALYIEAARAAAERHALGLADELYARAIDACEEEHDALSLMLERVEKVLLHTLSLEAARETLEAVISGARTAHRPQLRARATTSLGEVCAARGDLRRAERLLREASARYEQLASSKGQADVSLILGRIKLSELKLDEAREHTARAAEIYRRIKSSAGLARSQLQQGDIAWRSQRTREAESFFERARVLFTRLADPRGEATSTVWLGQIAHEQRRHDVALQFARVASARFEELEDFSGLAQCEIVSARAERALGADLRALEHARRARALLRRTRDPHHEILAIAEIAAHHLEHGRIERAQKLRVEAAGLAPDEVTWRALEVFDAMLTTP